MDNVAMIGVMTNRTKMNTDHVLENVTRSINFIWCWKIISVRITILRN
ncbi:hypothetical protein LSH36_2033g00004 [Paralvinella palmiformis]|uniref:Uncharacterized protein n=1 Tax=Paralvinella palmiformis TaxID=53620 RepID=A0AAD9IR87_9ANNE|nr:hypothetical protein LSH36_2033g00004 [Paralvinella palmiformis]